MKYINKILIFTLLVSVFIACEKEEDLGKSELFVTLSEENEVDKYIKETFTKPYNMVIDYKWPGNEVDFSKELVPVTYEKVKPFCEMINNVWVKPYINLAGDVFVKKYFPKQLVLVGGNNYNSDGSVTEAQAEGGKKITVFAVNKFEKILDADTEELKKAKISLLLSQCRTLHHEFCHILHQTKEFDPAFKEISQSRYTSKWYDFKDAQANTWGFVSAYAMESPYEDFVETLAHMITRSKIDWDVFVDSCGEGKEILRKKERYVVDYFEQKWGIDVYKLQKKVSKEIEEALK